MATGTLTSLLSDEEEDVQIEASQEDGIPRYGESNEPDWAASLREAADLSDRAPEALMSDLDERQFGQRYASSGDAAQENYTYSELKIGPKPPLTQVAKTDPDETPFTTEDLNPANSYALTIPGAEKPIEEGGEPWGVRDTVNFLFGEDMAILGVKWDEEGLNFSIENAMEQWSEHPIMSTLSLAGLVASTVFPAIGAVRKSAKIGRIAARNAEKFVSVAGQRKVIGEAVNAATKFDAQAGKAITDFPLLGFKGKSGLKEMTLLKHGDDWTATLGDLVKDKDDFAKFLPKHFGVEDAAKIETMIGNGLGEEAVELVGKKNIKRMLLGRDHVERSNMLKWKMDFGMASPLEEKKFQLL